MIFGSILPLISSQYSLNDAICGALLSAHQAGSLIASFVAGILPVFMGRKKSIIFLCTFVIFAFLIMITTKNPLLLIIAFLFTGISRGSCSNFNNYVVNDITHQNASALNFLHSSFAVGALLAPILAMACIRVFGDTGWKQAGFVIIFLVLLAILFFSKMKLSDKREDEGTKDLSYDFLKFKKFWISSFILFFYLCAESAITGWIVKYFVDTNILSQSYAQGLSSLLWAVMLIGRLICAYLAGRFSKKAILLITSLGSCVFYIVLLMSENKTIITLSIAFLGLFMSGIYPTTIASVGKTLKSYKMAMGTILVTGSLGGILMPTLCGAISHHFGKLYGMASIWGAIFLMLALVFANVLIKEE